MGISFRDRFNYSTFNSLRAKQKNYMSINGITDQKKYDAVQDKIKKCVSNLSKSEDFLYELYLNGRGGRKAKYHHDFYNLCRYSDTSDIATILASKLYDDKQNDIEQILDACVNLSNREEFMEIDGQVINKVLGQMLVNNKINEETIDKMSAYWSKPELSCGERYKGNNSNIVYKFLKENVSPELVDQYLHKNIQYIMEKMKNNDIDESVIKKVSIMITNRIKNDKTTLTSAFDLANYDNQQLMSFARIGTTDLSHLNVEQINNINVKTINQILSLAEEKFDEIPYELNENLISASVAFGPQKVTDLINGKYGPVDMYLLHSLFDGMRVDNYVIDSETKNVTYNEAQSKLVSFLFASGPNDPNANIKKVLNGELDLIQFPINRLVNEWPLHYEFLDKKMDLQSVLKQLTNVEIKLSPELYEIEPILKMTGVSEYDNVVTSFNKMSERTSSSIPKIEGKIGNLEYEILDLNDPIQMTVGYQTHCCFTFGGASESALKDACSSDSSRIFVLKQNGEIVAQSWIWRNGNIACFDNIEVVGTDRSGDKSRQYYSAYEEAAKNILLTSEEKEGKPIQAVTVGLSYTKIDLPGKIIDGKILLPKPGLYTDAKKQIMVAHSKNYLEPITYEPKPVYEDPRKEIQYIDPQQSTTIEKKKTEEHINKINHLVNSEKYNPIDLNVCTFIVKGQDWYIGITTDGEIMHNNYSRDSRSADEMKNSLETIKTKIAEGQLTEYLNDAVKSNVSSDTKGVK